MTAERPLIVRRMGLVEYDDGLRMQEYVAEDVRQGGPDHLFLLEHPHVLTMGRRGGWANLLVDRESLARRGVELFETDRGGDITYHGPGQIVGYPVLALAEGERDVRRFVVQLERLLIAVCADFGVDVVAGEPGRTGVWAPEGKVGAIGVRIDRWVTRHGFALNVGVDLDYFSLIVPCGIAAGGVASLADLAPSAPSVDVVLAALTERAGAALGRTVRSAGFEREAVQVIVWRRGANGPEVLILDRLPERGGFRQPVTGIIDPGETPRQTAAREVAEETGLTPHQDALQDLDYVHSFLIEKWARPGNPAGAFCREHSFAWQASADAQVRISEHEHQGHAWLPFDEAIAAVRWKGNVRGIGLVSERVGRS